MSDYQLRDRQGRYTTRRRARAAAVARLIRRAWRALDALDDRLPLTRPEPATGPPEIDPHMAAQDRTATAAAVARLRREAPL